MTGRGLMEALSRIRVRVSVQIYPCTVQLICTSVGLLKRAREMGISIYIIKN